MSGSFARVRNDETVLISGSNSPARRVVLNASDVRFDIDNSGDGRIDISIESSWDALLEQAGSLLRIRGDREGTYPDGSTRVENT